jgi:predicted transcriptional regulator
MKRGKAQQLGELERLVMDQLWKTDGGLTVRELANVFPKYAYTTVLTVCDRLLAKGMVIRELEGRANRFYPTASLEQYVTSLMEAALGTSGDRSAVLMHFVDSMDAQDIDLLRRALRRRGA